MSRACAIGLILCAVTASAQESAPELAPFPLEIIRTPPESTKKDKEDLQMLLPMMIRAADASVPDSAKLSAALASLGPQDCSRDDACLAQLGKLAGSLYAFYAQLDFDLDGNVVASGRVVRDDGRTARAPKTVKVAQGPSFRETAQVAIKKLLAELDVAHLSPFRPQEPVVEVKPAPVAAQPLLPPVTTSVNTHRLWTPALIAAGAGAACLVAGGALFATSGGARTDVSPQGVVRVFNEDAPRVAGIERAQTAGVALLAVGAALGALGTGLYLFGPTETTTTLVPINGGAAVLMSGALP